MPSMSAPDTIRHLSMAAYLARAFQVVAELGVADAIAAEAEPVEAIAAKCGVNSDALLRVLRLLAANAVFSVEGGKVSHTDASLLLRTDHPRSMRALPLLYGLPVFWAPFAGFDHALKTGKAVSQAYPENDLWEVLRENPAQAQVFDAAMAGRAHAQVAATIANYDFSLFERVADIGGGRGHLIKAVLNAAPDAQGIVFDLPRVVASIEHLSNDRLKLQGGDFFKDPLPSCDLYLFMDVIHDWADAESQAILQATRRAAPAEAKILIIEHVTSENQEIEFAKTIDIVMLALLGGKQRTMGEWQTLLQKSGWSLSRVIKTDSGLSLIEGSAA